MARKDTCPICGEVKNLINHHKLHPKHRYKRSKKQTTVLVCKDCETAYHAFHRQYCEGGCYIDFICEYIHLCGFWRENLV